MHATNRRLKSFTDMRSSVHSVLDFAKTSVASPLSLCSLFRCVFPSSIFSLFASKKRMEDATAPSPGDATDALLRAVESGNVDLCKSLIKEKVDVNDPRPGGGVETALYVAVTHNRLEIIALLCEARADVNGEPRHFTILHEAANEGHAEAVKLLVALGAKINAPSMFGTPIHVAARKGHLDCVKALLDAEAHAASTEGAFNDNMLLFAAAEASDADVMQFLVDRNIGDLRGRGLHVTDDSGRTLLHTAASRARARTAWLLFELKSDVNKCTSNPLQTTPFLEACGAWGAKSDKDILKCVKTLIAARSDTEAKDARGDCGLHWAASRGNVAVLQLLLAGSIGGSVNQCNNVDQTPLHDALRNGQLEAARLLIENRACVDIKDAVRVDVSMRARVFLSLA